MFIMRQTPHTTVCGVCLPTQEDQLDLPFKKWYIINIIPGSSNGRTWDFGPHYFGSSPNPGAK